MNLVEKIGQMLVYGWKGDQPDESRAINVHARALIEEFHVGGIIIMGRNVGSSTPADMLALTEEFQAMAQATDMPPLLVCADQEGGRVCRFIPPHFAAYPTPFTQGQSNDPYVARVTARGIGNEMCSIGVNWVLAPVLDVNNNPSNPVIGDRSFGADPNLVAAMGIAAVTGYQDDAGVMACGKHFPGHGDTDIDSHLALPRVSHSMAHLESVEFVPFRAAIEAEVGSIMTTHILFDALDDNLPATLSPSVLSGLLRKNMQFDGLIITDCLEMKGITNRWGTAEAAVLAAIAGADQILVCHTYQTQRRVIDALVDAVTEGRLSEERVDEANRRIARAKRRWIHGV